MKASEIAITEKTILLGVFGTKTFVDFRTKNKSIKWYTDFWKMCNPEGEYPAVLRLVRLACEYADKIVFVLDDVHFPIDVKNSVTCAELELICKFEEFYNKTTFIKGENVIEFDRNLVI